ncbi:hypothetical protein, partial [uncultured Acidaminococcus sp.]|uniref:hypothetical protein n=1 Tax=uncultured Acidaminococcus sp. TaxID=352152 RepID=UPI0025D71EE6
GLATLYFGEFDVLFQYLFVHDPTNFREEPYFFLKFQVVQPLNFPEKQDRSSPVNYSSSIKKAPHPKVKCCLKIKSLPFYAPAK